LLVLLGAECYLCLASFFVSIDEVR
jgi:hypothetical protein